MTQDLLQERLRKIPAVDQMLLRPGAVRWVALTSRSFVVAEIQKLLQEAREALRSGDACADGFTDPEELDRALENKLQARLRPALRAVINATGVMLHTNLGRAPLSAAAQKCLSAVSSRYTNLEFDLKSGERSYRDALLEPLLAELLGCESAVVVNNNAAAVFLILNTLAFGKEAIVSRGELIEIGGSFRIPDILLRSGATLREVGTTNKTRIRDYESAIGPDTALILRVHPSNYRIRGFTHKPKLSELAALARGRGLPLVEDIGSGCLVDLSRFGVQEEPIAQESIWAGVDLVCFSGDKLLGGPQAGIIAGAGRHIEAIRKNPLMRVCRVEKLIYGALEATLLSYRSGRALEEIPVLNMISMPLEELRLRARRFASKLRPKLPEGVRVDLIDGESVVGGGSCPDCSLPAVLIAIDSVRSGPNEIEARLRAQDPPIIVRLEEDRTLIDLRTVFPQQETVLLEGVLAALSST
jgi:L-seryl-tRNA(Ser) seleniumtransferase